jgi:hypothetical protein
MIHDTSLKVSLIRSGSQLGSNPSSIQRMRGRLLMPLPMLSSAQTGRDSAGRQSATLRFGGSILRAWVTSSGDVANTCVAAASTAFASDLGALEMIAV